MRFFEEIKVQAEWAMAIIALSGIILLASSCENERPPVRETSTPIIQNNTPNPVSDEPRKVENKTVVKPEGWLIPDVSKFARGSRSKIRLQDRTLDKFEYTATSDVVYQARRHWAPSDDTEHWLITKLVRFESRGKPIAFFISGGKVAVNEDGTVKARVATAIGIMISDMDGDGIFESLDFVSPHPNAALPKMPGVAED